MRFSLFGLIDGRDYINKYFFLLSTRLVFLVSGGPGRPPLSGRSVALGLRNKLRKQKNDFLIFKARRVDTVSEYLTNTVYKRHAQQWKRRHETENVLYKQNELAAVLQMCLLYAHFELLASGRSWGQSCFDL